MMMAVRTMFESGEDKAVVLFAFNELTVTQAVHENNGKIFMQIWHVGRVSHPHYLNGHLPLAPSATTMSGRVSRSDGLHYGQSRAVTDKEIDALIADFVNAAVRAIEAGCDGVELHGANGYLLDQFLHYDTNHRTDEYGGSPENNSRFVAAVVQACGQAIGYERVGIRLSPGAYLNEVNGDSRDAAVFAHLLSLLSDLPIAYVHTGNFDHQRVFSELGGLTMTDFIRQHYQGTLIACGGYDASQAEASIEKNKFDLIAMGRPFIANPDLVEKIQSQLPLTPYHRDMLLTLD